MPSLVKTLRRKNPDSVNAVPVTSMVRYVLSTTLSNVKAGWVEIGVADGFQVTSIGVTGIAALAAAAPVKSSAANVAAKYFLSCMVFPFSGRGGYEKQL